MTVNDIRALTLNADPEARHYAQPDGKRGNYTTWRETRRLAQMADDEHVGGWAFTIDRYTKTEFDTVAQAIEQTLTADPRVAFSHIVDYEPDTRYIHHIFDCEGI